MQEKNEIAIFENRKIRRLWREEDWWFVVEDVVSALTDSSDPKQYISKLRQRDEVLSQGWVQIVHPLPIPTAGGTQNVNCANLEGIFRIIQSIPSPKAEPFKLWLVKVGYQRIEENYDPELAINRALNTYLKKGYSIEWINQRLKAIEVRKELTDEWGRSGIEKPSEFASLTNTLTKAWSDRTVREYKDFKNLKKENLRDNMTNIELVLNLLAEATTTEISKNEDPEGFIPSKNVAKRGGKIAGNTRKEIEDQLGKTVISSKNAKQLLAEKKKKLIS